MARRRKLCARSRKECPAPTQGLTRDGYWARSGTCSRTPAASSCARRSGPPPAVTRGQGNKQIARTLHISEATVKTHLLHIYAKLDVDDRTAAVTTALERGMIRLG